MIKKIFFLFSLIFLVACSNAYQNSLVNDNAGNRLVLRSVSLEFLTDDIEDSKSDIKKEMENNGGFFSSENGFNLVVHVPNNNIDTFIESLESFGYTDNKNKISEDVTSKIEEIDIKKDRYSETLQRYNTLLEKEKDTEDSIKIQKEIDTINDNIFNLNSEKSELVKNIDFTTVKINFNGMDNSGKSKTNPEKQQNINAKKIAPYVGIWGIFVIIFMVAM